MLTLKLVPLPNLLSTLICPPNFSMIPRETERPNPVPSPGGLVVKKGSNILARFSGGIPGPLSRTTAMASFSLPVMIISTKPPGETA